MSDTPTATTSPWVSKTELADMLRVTRQQFRQRYATRADFPKPMKLTAHHWIYKRAEVEAWIEKQA